MDFREVQASSEDLLMLRNLMSNSENPARERQSNEDFVRDHYLNGYISKPWGHECRVYIDNIHDIWKLTILPGHETSTHCHPRKDTVLLCLSGEGRFRCTYGARTVKSGDFVHVRKGAFHSTANIGNSDLELIEVEMPRNKFDLVRMEDSYGRAANGYENEAHHGHRLPPMETIEHGKTALLRKGDLLERYCFKVNRFNDIADGEDLLFLINIDVEPFINNRIGIIREMGAMSDTEKEHGNFFSISCKKINN